MITTLTQMGHKNPPTPIETENSVYVLKNNETVDKKPFQYINFLLST